VRLRHRGLGALEHVGDQARIVGQRRVTAVDVTGRCAVDQKQVVRALAPGDVDVFAKLDVALGAEDRAAPVAPRGQAVGRVPIDAEVAVAALAAQQDLVEVLDLGLIRLDWTVAHILNCQRI
jgi:hypothetical protein